MVKERHDITGSKCIKGALGKVIVDGKGIKDSWKEYMEKLLNEENEWDHKISAEVKEGPADCIRMAEVRAVLKKMKRHKALGLSGLVAEMIQATGDIGIQWILDLCNGIVKEGSIPGIGIQVWYCQSTKAKVTLWSVDRIEGSNCWNML